MICKMSCLPNHGFHGGLTKAESLAQNLFPSRAPEWTSVRALISSYHHTPLVTHLLALHTSCQQHPVQSANNITSERGNTRRHALFHGGWSTLAGRPLFPNDGI
jgi:hypothetical protein